MKWLQISDLHFGYTDYETKMLRRQLIEFLEKIDQIDFILISGDCMYCHEGENCADFILELGQVCDCSKENIFICPGNHDINLANRNLLLFEFDGDSNQYEALSSFGFEKFRNLYRKIKESEYKPYQVIERHNGSEKFRIINVDSCLFLDEKASQNNLSIVWNELEKLVGQIRNDEYINILNMHHGLECFEPNSRRRFRKWIEENYIDIVFCGHSAADEINTYISTPNQIQQFSSGMVPLGDNATPNFWVCQYESDSAIIEMSLYTYNQSGTIFKSCLWSGDSYHYRIHRRRINTTNFFNKTDDIISNRQKGDVYREKLIYKEIKAFHKAIKNILDEPYNIHSSTSRTVSPDGIICYNRLANKFNQLFPEADMFIFREDITPNLVTYPKTQEILYQLEYALDIIIDDLNQKKEYVILCQNDDRNSKGMGNNKNKVFVVHGHDEAAKQTVARFLEKCEFEVIILHEQPDGGRTIIEKIEEYTDVVFAIVLYTPCDIGRAKEEKKGKPRARQNVIFEHGYLIGKLGRERVCALVKDGLETPEDISNAIYKLMDKAGAWKTAILKEMKNVGISVDASKLL